MSDSPLSDVLMAYRKACTEREATMEALHQLRETINLHKFRLEDQKKECEAAWNKLLDLCIGYERTSD